MELAPYLADRRALVETALDALIPAEGVAPCQLHRAIRYSVMAPGKRLRPILVLASAEAVGGDPDTVMPTACALECVHAFSLIHDDMPCMDDDDFRRGRPTSHKVFGEATALLAGDALLALAFELIASNASIPSATNVGSVIGLVARASGTRGMVGGQVADMNAEGHEITPDEIEYIHRHKTGALIAASATVGAMLCGASEKQVTLLDEFGQCVGLAFQIADDILDLTGDFEKLGKTVGSDVRHDKATYPRVYGVEESRRIARREVDRAVAALDSFGQGADALRQMALYVVDRDT